MAGTTRTALYAGLPRACHRQSMSLRGPPAFLTSTAFQHQEGPRQPCRPAQHRQSNFIVSQAGKSTSKGNMQRTSTEAEQFSLLRTSSAQWEEATQTAAGWRQRAIANVAESLLLTYTTLVESVLVTVADTLRLSAFLNWLTPRLEGAIATVTGRHLFNARE